MSPNAYRTRTERGEVQLGTWITFNSGKNLIEAALVFYHDQPVFP